MKKDLLNENRPRILLSLFSLAALVVLLLGADGLTRLFRRNNDQAVAAALAGLSYTESRVSEELGLLQPLADREPLSDAARGQLYRALAEISYMTGDDMQYNQYIAYALFYLDRAGDADSITYLTNKYIGRLYANGCYQSAAEVLARLADRSGISALPLELQASYYLSCADVDEMLGVDPQPMLDDAQAAIRLMPEGGARSLQQAKLELLSARRSILNGDFASAGQIMARYTEADDFGLGANQVYVVCDYLIPYYEITVKLALEKKDFETAYRYVDKYLSACDSYQFRAMKLHLLQYVVSHSSGSESQDREKYQALERQVSQKNLDEMTNEYGAFLLADIDSTTKDLADLEQMKEERRRNVLLALAGLYLLIVLYCAAAIMLDYMSRDGLTRLKSRQKYERARIVCERKKLPYCLLMLDIDDFKHVNDTFGHEQGDIVLRSIAALMLRYTGRGISAYRYGGEELCMLFLGVSEERARAIAEELRAAVEHTVGTAERRVTISGGLGVSLAGENVFRIADQKLYAAKANGKNQIQ